MTGQPSTRAPVAGCDGSPSVLLAGSPANKTNLQLVAAWRELGIDVELGLFERVRNRLRSKAVVIGRLDVLPTLDGVEPGLLDLFWLERRGVRVLNRVTALLCTHDKLSTARALDRRALPSPPTTYLTPGGARPELSPPLVVKPRFGSWGRDVFRCDTIEELRRCLAEIRARSWFRRHGALVQALVEPRGHDLRVLVAGSSVVGAVERIAAAGEWRTNVALGGSRRPCVPSPGASELALAAAVAVGTDLVVVDLLPVDGSYVILELNGAADFDRVYSLPGRDVYADVADALRLRAEPSRRRQPRDNHTLVTRI